MNINSDISDKIFLADLKAEFLKSIEVAIIEFEKFPKERNFPELRKLIHNIKGTAEPMGFPEGSKIAADLLNSILNDENIRSEEIMAKLIEYLKNIVVSKLKEGANSDNE